MPLIFPSNTLSAGGFSVDNSLRWNDGDSPYLSRVNGTPTNADKWTFSIWVKRGALGSEQKLIAVEGDSLNNDAISFDSSDQLRWYGITSSSTYMDVKTNRVFRDPSAWMHLCFIYDSGQGTDSDRAKIYVNGTQETSFATETYPDQDEDSYINKASKTTIIGRQSWAASGYFDGYMAEVTFCDGQAYAPDGNFGEFNEDTPTVFQPIDVSGLTFGTNGFYLDFEDSTNLGNDANGGTDFTATNLAAIDQCTDSPTNNFATLNALLPTFSSTFSEGNCKWTLGTDSQYYWSNSTFGLSQGKWYMEAKLTTAAAHNYIGISVDQPDDSTTFLAGGGGAGGANDLYEWGWKSSDGKIYNNTDGGTAYGNTYTTGDILGMYLDLDNNKLYFAKNGTIENSGTGISITDPASTPTGFYFPCVADGSSSASSVWEVNFGNPTFSISSGNSDPNGYGNFEYSPNDGGSASFDSSAKDFYALNTKNLAEYG